MRLEIKNKVGRWSFTHEKVELKTIMTLFKHGVIPTDKIAIYNKHDELEINEDVSCAIDAIDNYLERIIFTSDRADLKAFRQFLIDNQEDIELGMAEYKIEALEKKKESIQGEIDSLKKRLELGACR